ncbi:MAG TPA: sensor histidine kinase [Candidatus Acidoferrum sp.]|nr:sensor histidine kinase [Candidatus Acidoferrum sp.]
MSLDSVERLYLERQVTLGRAVLVSLSLIVLLETSQEPVRRASVVFLFVYLAVALAAVLIERFFASLPFRIPLAADCLALALFFYLTPSVSAFWFLFLFVVFALATRGKTRAVLALVIVATAGVIIRVALGDPFRWQSVWHWLAIGFGTIVSGLGMGFLGAREGDYLSRQRFIEKITGLLHFDRGLTESVRQALGELALEFECEQACLAVRDDELERLFVWKVRPNDRESAEAETLPLSRSDAFLIDTLEVSLGWAFRNGTGEGFGWDRRSGERFHSIPAPTDAARNEFAARELMAATIESEGRPAGRVLLVNPRRRFSVGDLRHFEQVVRHIGPPLENIFLLRNLRARAVESERSRISRDLHDGILQTLMSLHIQLDVLRRKLPQAPDQVAEDLANLQQTMQHESLEFRRMVTDMRPLRVESADMRELMLGFAERFRNESGIAIDLFIEDRNLRLPDRLCRELFQIYRESLHNIKKHANASHVVVKLGQDETKVSLVVDDNGSGFSFSGRFTSEELDRLRLGPISIKERTRSVGGTLTVESNPGHGARLTIEIPLN